MYLCIEATFIFSHSKWRFACLFAISNAQIISGASEQLEGTTSSFHPAKTSTKCAINPLV
jgi:hypothetical protein